MRIHDLQWQPHSQRGMALVMALIFLLLLTILGVTTMNTSSLEERMANNSKDRGLAFQASDSALLTGESWIANQVIMPIFDESVLNDGLHLPATTNTPVWSDAGSINVWTGNDFMTDSSLTKVASSPKVIIEDLGPVRDAKDSIKASNTYSGGMNAFRVTSRGVGSTPLASVMVQSVYVRRF
jgi:type IV pilus assembly protein PilX